MLPIVLIAQLAVAGTRVPPLLAFPEAGMDDSASYAGYQTRFYKDVAGNTLQIYLDQRSGRVVNLWADADNESLGFTINSTDGRPARVTWGAGDARVAGTRRRRIVEYALASSEAGLDIGWFLMGSMRVERDFQYWGWHRARFDTTPGFVLPEFQRLIDELERLPASERTAHLALLRAPSVAALRSRLRPAIRVARQGRQAVARIAQPAFDARDTLWTEIRVDAAHATMTARDNYISLRRRGTAPLQFAIRIETHARPLTPLTRREIFTADFLRFAASLPGSSTRARWVERQIRGVELLSSREKLMAGLPNYATYFGRDMLVSALMMRSIWRGEMSEFAIAAALRKLRDNGEVSHEEALGGQAIREAANDYVAALRDGDGARARAVLRDARRVRENYHMIDDELQLPVLAGQWIADSTISNAHKRAFLLDTTDFGEPRVNRLLRELSVVLRMMRPYALAAPATAGNLISFPQRDATHWSSASWRDSNAGYAGGRFAMDVNAIWAPHALAGIDAILAGLPALGIALDSSPGAEPGTAPLRDYVRSSAAMHDAWRDAWRHFVVRLAPSEVQARVAARLAALPAAERDYWMQLLASTRADRDSLTFLALALDGDARPIGVVNSDVATRLFLGEVPYGERPMDDVMRDVRTFTRAYPVGLFIDRVGPVVANDAYAPPGVWPEFERDRYHGPRVVWGREVNLFLLGVANRLAAMGDRPEADELRAAIAKIRDAVRASGFRSELWSYEFRDGRPAPVRYGTGSDVQLWSTTDLAVEYALSKLP